MILYNVSSTPHGMETDRNRNHARQKNGLLKTVNYTLIFGSKITGRNLKENRTRGGRNDN